MVSLLGNVSRESRKVGWGSREGGLHLCSRRFLSSEDAAPTCRPQSGRQARSIAPAPHRRSCSDKWRHPRSARTGCEERFSPSTYRTHSAETDSPGWGLPLPERKRQLLPDAELEYPPIGEGARLPDGPVGSGMECRMTILSSLTRISLTNSRTTR